MAQSAALLVDDVLPHEHIRQWVLSFPFQLRFLFASYPHIMGKVLGIVYRTFATHITARFHIIKEAGYNKQTAQTDAVTLIQRFGSALTKSPGAILNSRRLAPNGRRAGRPKSFKYQFFICSTSMVYMPKITMAKRVWMRNILVSHLMGNQRLSSLFIWNKQQQLCWPVG
jgi:hypothetical protein